MPKVSVVIPTYNEATYVDRLLEALTKQNFKDFEVIVSDAESKDGVDEVVNEFSKKFDVKLVESPPKGPGIGRNVGAKLARGEWLLFLDADIDIDDPNFIGSLLDWTVHNGYQTSTTKMAAQNLTFAEKIGFNINYNYIKLLSHTKKPVAQGYCILTKRSLFAELDGFNEKIQFGEDYDYVTRASKNGFGIFEGTYYYVDMRRPQSEGSLFVIKTIINEIYRHLPGRHLERNLITYEFGKHKKRGQD